MTEAIDAVAAKKVRAMTMAKIFLNIYFGWRHFGEFLIVFSTANQSSLTGSQLYGRLISVETR